MTDNFYAQGAWNVICDRCGRKRKNYECTLQMIPEKPNLFVCTDHCLDKHNPQLTDVVGIPDLQAVPLARPGDGYTVYSLASPFGYGSLTDRTNPSNPINNINGNNQPDT